MLLLLDSLLQEINSIVKMTGDTAVEVPVVDDNKVEDVVKTDKEVIAEEEKELIENEKTDEPEKTGEGTPDTTGYLEVEIVGGAVLHTKKGGDGYVDTSDKMNKIFAGVEAALA